mmetsp:Transcript_10158/g.30101  ORF Transcript_10158/g.30101 Transcript_10158/m.30101 type:complete len:236 (-) Transcript_10158:346-1053(-)
MEHQVGLALAHRVAQVDHHEHDRTQRLDRHRVRAAQRGDHLDLAPHALEHERPLVLEHHDRLERRREHVVVHHLDHRHQRLRQRADGAARDDGVEHVVDPEPEERARAAAVHAHLLVQGRERAAALLHGRALGAIGQRHVVRHRRELDAPLLLALAALGVRIGRLARGRRVDRGVAGPRVRRHVRDRAQVLGALRLERRTREVLLILKLALEALELDLLRVDRRPPLAVIPAAEP